jgi:hypothetical protein
MATNTPNRNGKMLLANWFEISELEYAQYRLQGYTIAADSERIIWLLDSKLHRTDGPARIWASGTQVWYQNGKLHRESGPARIWENGDQEWYLNGKRHRTDGPARIWADGTRAWYLNGKQYTESEWHTACGHLLQNPDITHAVSE